MSLLEVLNLTVDYRERSVLRDVSFTLEEGDRVALVGPNGAGKTTLLASLVGLVSSSSGRITWNGRVCNDEDDWRFLRRGMTLLFQDPDDQLFCPTVLEDVAFGPCNLGYSYREAEDKARAILCELEMGSYADRMSHLLSGGEKKMVALACVLAMEPKIILLDEPFAGLDEKASGRVEAVINNLDCGFLMVSHNRQAVKKLNPTIWRLSDGHLSKSNLIDSI